MRREQKIDIGVQVVNNACADLVRLTRPAAALRILPIHYLLVAVRADWASVQRLRENMTAGAQP